ncbi:uncharacterized protein LOC134197738 isoform X2 [Corticium candelabrum]|uniref:uncharacterized protein LOC134197738 isoform X2 n=1 Tax=Corticium candelabrum TaxID=121492 RepID=UPI002E26F2F5|nr:uncharacterized protein LOC134197738 isoform X2 [Corticium candelabrum]
MATSVIAEEAFKHCPNCKVDIPAANFVVHEPHCKRNISLCKVCAEPVRKSQQDEHDEEFHAEVVCKCGKKMEKRFVEEHDTSECVQRLMKCEFCELEIMFREYDDHRNYCGSRTEKCVKCDKFIQKKEQTFHDATRCGGLLLPDDDDDDHNDVVVQPKRTIVVDVEIPSQKEGRRARSTGREGRETRRNHSSSTVTSGGRSDLTIHVEPDSTKLPVNIQTANEYESVAATAAAVPSSATNDSDYAWQVSRDLNRLSIRLETKNHHPRDVEGPIAQGVESVYSCEPFRKIEEQVAYDLQLAQHLQYESTSVFDIPEMSDYECQMQEEAMQRYERERQKKGDEKRIIEEERRKQVEEDEALALQLQEQMDTEELSTPYGMAGNVHALQWESRRRHEEGQQEEATRRLEDKRRREKQTDEDHRLARDLQLQLDKESRSYSYEFDSVDSNSESLSSISMHSRDTETSALPRRRGVRYSTSDVDLGTTAQSSRRSTSIDDVAKRSSPTDDLGLSRCRHCNEILLPSDAAVHEITCHERKSAKSVDSSWSMLETPRTSLIRKERSTQTRQRESPFGVDGVMPPSQGSKFWSHHDVDVTEHSPWDPRIEFKGPPSSSDRVHTTSLVQTSRMPTSHVQLFEVQCPSCQCKFPTHKLVDHQLGCQGRPRLSHRSQTPRSVSYKESQELLRSCLYCKMKLPLRSLKDHEEECQQKQGTSVHTRKPTSGVRHLDVQCPYSDHEFPADKLLDYQRVCKEESRSRFSRPSQIYRSMSYDGSDQLGRSCLYNKKETPLGSLIDHQEKRQQKGKSETDMPVRNTSGSIMWEVYSRRCPCQYCRKQIKLADLPQHQVECDQNRSLSPQLRQELIGSERCIPKSKVTQTKPPSKRSRDVEAVNLSKQTSNRSERPYAARLSSVSTRQDPSRLVNKQLLKSNSSLYPKPVVASHSLRRTIGQEWQQQNSPLSFTEQDTVVSGGSDRFKASGSDRHTKNDTKPPLRRSNSWTSLTRQPRDSMEVVGSRDLSFTKKLRTTHMEPLAGRQVGRATSTGAKRKEPWH